MDLIFNKNNFDFWQFYMDNYDQIELIIWKFCWKYVDVYDPEDLHSELLLRLQRSCFHEDYNPELSKFNTFFTTRVRGYAIQIVNSHRYQENFYDRDEKDKKHFYTQYYIKDINGTKGEKHFDETLPEELKVRADFDNDILLDEITSIVEPTLSDRNKKILGFLNAGFSRNDISAIFNVSVQTIGNCCQKIKDCYYKVCKREGIILEKEKI